MVAYRTAGTASLGLLVSALIGCSSGSETADVQGIFDWDALIGAGTHAPQTQSFHARDGSTLFYRSYGEPASIDLILIHGSGAESTYLSSLAAEISRSGVSRVWTPDVRGHGASPARRGRPRRRTPACDTARRRVPPYEGARAAVDADTRVRVPP